MVCIGKSFDNAEASLGSSGLACKVCPIDRRPREISSSNLGSSSINFSINFQLSMCYLTWNKLHYAVHYVRPGIFQHVVNKEKPWCLVLTKEMAFLHRAGRKKKKEMQRELAQPSPSLFKGVGVSLAWVDLKWTQIDSFNVTGMCQKLYQKWMKNCKRYRWKMIQKKHLIPKRWV